MNLAERRTQRLLSNARHILAVRRVYKKRTNYWDLLPEEETDERASAEPEPSE